MSTKENDVFEETKREAEEEFNYSSQKEHLERVKAMQEMDKWACAESAKRLRQSDLKQVIEDLVAFYEGRFGSRLYQ